MATNAEQVLPIARLRRELNLRGESADPELQDHREAAIAHVGERYGVPLIDAVQFVELERIDSDTGKFSIEGKVRQINRVSYLAHGDTEPTDRDFTDAAAAAVLLSPSPGALYRLPRVSLFGDDPWPLVAAYSKLWLRVTVGADRSEDGDGSGIPESLVKAVAIATRANFHHFPEYPGRVGQLIVGAP